MTSLSWSYWSVPLKHRKPPDMDLSRMHKRFWKYVHPCPLTGCWHWAGPRAGEGYGAFRIGKVMYSHRYAYAAIHGDVPAGLHIDHLCRNRNCCNPMHLEAVTCKDNLMRGHGTIARINAEKTRCLNGHLLSGDNLVIVKSHGGRYSHRVCRECRRQRSAYSNDRKKWSASRKQAA